MIARVWRGWTTLEKADDYYRHFTSEVVPNLEGIAGNRGAYLLKRRLDVEDAEVEFLAITLWDSIETIKRFSGDDPDRAHIEPEGKAALSKFDEFVRNYEIICNTVDEG